MELRDLPPRKDPKGGTPPPIPVSEYNQQVQPNGTWRNVAAIIGGITVFVGMVYAVGEHMAEFNSLKRTVDEHSQQIREMDQHGTSYTRWQMDQDLKFHEDVEKRLRRLEQK